VYFGIRAKQIGAVSLIVGVAVIALSLLHVTFVARVLLEESRSRAELLANTVFQRAKDVVPGQAEPWAAISADGGLQAILESGAFARNVTYAAICNLDGEAVAAWDPSRVGKVLPPAGDLDALIRMGGVEQLLSIYRSNGQTLEVQQPLLLGGEKFGTIRIGVSTLLVREEFSRELWLVVVTGLIALFIAVIVSAALAKLILKPIHVLKSGLTRLGRGEFGVRLDLPQQDEFGELGSFFNVVSAQLSVGRAAVPDPKAGLAPAVDHVGDEVAVFNRVGTLLFANAAMLATLPSDPVGRTLADLLPEGHPYRDLVRGAADGLAAGPVSAGGWQRIRRPRDGRRARGDGLPRERRRRAPDLRPARRAGCRGARPRAVDAELLAQARRPRPAVGRRRARGEEPAQRDDDPPRTARVEAAAGL
jgi:PAS domain-containing protein